MSKKNEKALSAQKEMQEFLKRKPYMKESYEALVEEMQGKSDGQQISLIYERIFKLLKQINSQIKDLGVGV